MRNEHVLAFLSILLFLFSVLYTKVKTSHIEYNDREYALHGFVSMSAPDGHTVLLPAYTEVKR